MTWRRIVMRELDREEGSRMERKRWMGGDKRGSQKQRVGDRIDNFLTQGRIWLQSFVLCGYLPFAIWLVKESTKEIWDFQMRIPDVAQEGHVLRRRNENLNHQKDTVSNKCTLLLMYCSLVLWISLIQHLSAQSKLIKISN